MKFYRKSGTHKGHYTFMSSNCDACFFGLFTWVFAINNDEMTRPLPLDCINRGVCFGTPTDFIYHLLIKIILLKSRKTFSFVEKCGIMIKYYGKTY